MSAAPWEYERVEKPFCRQLAAMDWQWIEGDPKAHTGYSLRAWGADSGEQHRA